MIEYKEGVYPRVLAVHTLKEVPSLAILVAITEDIQKTYLISPFHLPQINSAGKRSATVGEYEKKFYFQLVAQDLEYEAQEEENIQKNQKSNVKEML